jgi:hypothetical protein
VRERGEDVVSRFHPKKPVIACGIKNEIIFFSAENSSIPFSNWKNNGNKFQIGHEKGIWMIEWNVISSFEEIELSLSCLKCLIYLFIFYLIVCSGGRNPIGCHLYIQ